MQPSKYNFIVIEGNIGAGKTSLAKKLAADFNAKLVLERFAENPFLPKFYENPEKYAFQVETSFLIDRYQQLIDDLQPLELFRSFTISDYYFSKSLIFARNTLEGAEFQLYRKIYSIIYKNIPKPDLYVFLHVSIERLLKNIKKRGRPYEQNIKPEYLEKIQKAYFEYFNQQNDFRFLIIDTNEIDFVENQKHYNKLVEIIFDENHKKGINFVKVSAN